MVTFLEDYEVVFKKDAFVDLCPVMFGYGTAPVGVPIDISERFYYLIHYVISGKGYLDLNGQKHTVTKGQIFIIPSLTPNSYIADDNDPWRYVWIAFTGRLAPKFKELPPVLDINSTIFFDMMNAKNNLFMQQEFLLQKLFELYVTLFQENLSPSYSSIVKKYIDLNYSKNITVASISNSLGLNRSYLSRVFKKETGISIQDYIIKTRITKAVKLLESGESVKDVSEKVGYTDPFNFSKAFKNNIGINPTEYKRKK